MNKKILFTLIIIIITIFNVILFKDYYANKNKNNNYIKVDNITIKNSI